VHCTCKRSSIVLSTNFSNEHSKETGRLGWRRGWGVGSTNRDQSEGALPSIQTFFVPLLYLRFLPVFGRVWRVETTSDSEPCLQGQVVCSENQESCLQGTMECAQGSRHMSLDWNCMFCFWISSKWSFDFFRFQIPIGLRISILTMCILSVL
jgi:hypothetical protein